MNSRACPICNRVPFRNDRRHLWFSPKIYLHDLNFAILARAGAWSGWYFISSCEMFSARELASLRIL